MESEIFLRQGLNRAIRVETVREFSCSTRPTALTYAHSGVNRQSQTEKLIWTGCHRIYVAKVKAGMLNEHDALSTEYGAGLGKAIEKGWLWQHDSGTYSGLRKRA